MPVLGNPIMHARDSMHGALAKCFVTIEGRRMNMMSMTEFEANFDINIADVPILGKVNMGHKPAGGSGSFTGTAHYNQSVFRKLVDTYQKTGRFPYFEIQVTNEDPASSVGAQTVIFHDCLLDSVVMARFEAGNNNLTEDISGTYESSDIPREFNELEGM